MKIGRNVHSQASIKDLVALLLKLKSSWQPNAILNCCFYSQQVFIR